MVPVFVLVLASVLLRGVGWLGVKRLSSWRYAVRAGLAIMFLFTAAAHFTDTKHDLAAMIPAPLPKGLWLIYLTGLLEIAGAIGLLVPRFQRIAGICLVILLLAMFPANVNAALTGIPLRGEPPTPLWLRLPIQLLFIGAIWWTSIREPHSPASPVRPPQPA
jgi:uncharacterized membrane protein